MATFIDITGKRFGRLIATSYSAGTRTHRGYWTCMCDCGNTTNVMTSNLTLGKIKSCGCLIHDKKPVNFIHGECNTALFRVYKSMINRCENPRCKAYPYYGGRGIAVSHEWRSSFVTFKHDMGQKPSKGHTLERIDNNAGYSKQNCRWATKHEQANNRRNTRMLTVDGVTKPLTVWAKEYGIHPSCIRLRVNRFGWDHKTAVTTPNLHSHYSKRPSRKDLGDK